MPLGRPIPPMVVSPEMREQLHTMSRARSLPQALAKRARIILLAADGLSNTQHCRPTEAFPPHGGEVASALPAPGFGRFV